MKIGQIPEFMRHLTPQSPVPIFRGTTGIGKTMAVKQGAKLLNRTMAAIPPLSTMLPEDASGIPIPQKDTVKFMPPDFWNVSANTLMFLDEFSLASPDVMSTLCSVLWPLADGTRRIGSYILPDDLLVIAATMPAEPGSPSRPLPDFLRSRFRIIDVESDSNDWIPWAIANDIDPMIIAFIRNHPDLLAPKSTHTEYSFPTPRAWARLSYVITKEKLTGWMLTESANGMIGAGATSQFVSYCTNVNAIPNPINVLKGQEEFPKQADIAVITAVSTIQAIINDNSLIPYYFQQSIKWPVDYVVGLQLSAIAKLGPNKQLEMGIDLSTITIKYPDWLRKFQSLIHQVNI